MLRNSWFGRGAVFGKLLPAAVLGVLSLATAVRAEKAAVKYEIAIDCAEVPELKDWVEVTLRPTLEKWYPILVRRLPSKGFTAPRRLSVTFRKDMQGVAFTSGTRVFCAGTWFKANREGEAPGAVVHELVARGPANPQRPCPRLAN